VAKVCWTPPPFFFRRVLSAYFPFIIFPPLTYTPNATALYLGASPLRVFAIFYDSLGVGSSGTSFTPLLVSPICVCRPSTRFLNSLVLKNFWSVPQMASLEIPTNIESASFLWSPFFQLETLALYGDDFQGPSFYMFYGTAQNDVVIYILTRPPRCLSPEDLPKITLIQELHHDFLHPIRSKCIETLQAC